jgi:8-oxo-dGTP diphosphatase
LRAIPVFQSFRNVMSPDVGTFPRFPYLFRMKEVAVGIILQGDNVLACQRKRTVRYPLKWEFPGGKIEPGETAREAVIRELREELDIEAVPDDILLTHEWVYGNGSSGSAGEGRYRVTYFIVRTFSGTPTNITFEDIRWVAPSALLAMDILEGNRQAVALLLERSGKGGAERPAR